VESCNRAYRCDRREHRYGNSASDKPKFAEASEMLTPFKRGEWGKAFQIEGPKALGRHARISWKCGVAKTSSYRATQAERPATGEAAGGVKPPRDANPVYARRKRSQGQVQAGSADARIRCQCNSHRKQLKLGHCVFAGRYQKELGPPRARWVDRGISPWSLRPESSA